MKSVSLLLTIGIGAGAAALGLSSLKTTEEGIRHNRNPFGLQQSGYGKTLARLSQDTVDTIWHLGVEQVNPLSHDHANCDHEHGDCSHGESSDHAEAELELPEVPFSLSDESRELLVAKKIDPDEVDCSECLRSIVESLESGQVFTMEDLPAYHAFHQMPGGDASSSLALEEDGHQHGADCGHDCGHDHGASGDSVASVGGIDGAKDWLVNLRVATYNRTNPFGISDAHKKAVAMDIEKMLLRAYKMDPTDYGVYNAYFLFLTIHELRSTPLAKGQARLISQMTINEAFKEDVDPQPWLTAGMASLNLFFLEQQDARSRNQELPVAMIEKFQGQMGFCLQRYQVLKEKAIAEGRWEEIGEARRFAMVERAQFSEVSLEQFGTMLARARSKEEGLPARNSIEGANTGDPEKATVQVSETEGE